jgi:hypothetical protein
LKNDKLKKTSLVEKKASSIAGSSKGEVYLG